jgi:hypothetical protein
MPISFSLFKRSFTKITPEKAMQYHAAVVQCSADIEAIEIEHVDNRQHRYVAAIQRLNALQSETET